MAWPCHSINLDPVRIKHIHNFDPVRIEVRIEMMKFTTWEIHDLGPVRIEILKFSCQCSLSDNRIQVTAFKLRSMQNLHSLRIEIIKITCDPLDISSVLTANLTAWKQFLPDTTLHWQGFCMTGRGETIATFLFRIQISSATSRLRQAMYD